MLRASVLCHPRTLNPILSLYIQQVPSVQAEGSDLGFSRSRALALVGVMRHVNAIVQTLPFGRRQTLEPYVPVVAAVLRQCPAELNEP